MCLTPNGRKLPSLFDSRRENQICVSNFIKYWKLHVAESFCVLNMPYLNSQMPQGVGSQTLSSSHCGGSAETPFSTLSSEPLQLPSQHSAVSLPSPRPMNRDRWELGLVTFMPLEPSTELGLQQLTGCLWVPCAPSHHVQNGANSYI